MKKLKNNKGLTGIDIVVSITIIVIVLGIVTVLYGTYSKKSKEVKRITTATNLAVKVIEYIEGADINTLSDIMPPLSPTPENPNGEKATEVNSGNYGKYGLEATIPNGYAIKIITTIASDNELMNSLAFQVDVTVTYSVENKDKSITLSTIKKKSGIEEAEKPNIKGDIIYNNNNLTGNDTVVLSGVSFIPVKYDDGKDGYVKANQYDSEWYSISSKIFPMVVKLKDNENFNRNGIVKLSQCEYIYVWVPSYGTVSNGSSLEYRFCTKEGKIINYQKDANNNIATYIADTTGTGIVTSRISTGYWQRINLDEKPVNDSNEIIDDEDNAYNALKNNIFSWN